MRIMKNNIVILAAFIALLTSCEGFLGRNPYGSVSSENIFDSPILAENVVTGAYANLAYDYNEYHRTNWDALASPLDHSSRYGYLAGRIQPNNDFFLTYWKRFYEGINRANDVINNFHKVPEMEPEMKERRIAECKVLRAYHYYKLNCLWRGVPIYLENLAPSEYTRPRSSEEDVWLQVVKDCTDAIECESLPDKYDSKSTDWGRITKGVAYTLRGKAYLWLKEYALAESDFLKVGECGYGLFTGSYADLFTEKNERCQEMIFSVQMINEANCGNVFSYEYGNYNTTGYGMNMITLNTNFVDSYECADGKPFSWDDVIPGYSTMDPKARSVYFLRNSLKESEKNTMLTYGADMSKYSETGNEDRIKAAFANRDPRLAATAILPYSTYVGGASGKETTHTFRFPYRTENSPTFDIKTYSTTDMVYLMRKFVTKGREHLNIAYNPVDAPIFRYAEVLLCLAEAINEQGGRTSEAVAYVNKVRSRAGAQPLNSNTYTTVKSQEDLRRRIINEKKWELVGEMQLYFEELRWGTWKDDKFSDGNGYQQCWGDNIYNYEWGGEGYWRWPIPQSEREKNVNLKQNPLW